MGMTPAYTIIITAKTMMVYAASSKSIFIDHPLSTAQFQQPEDSSYLTCPHLAGIFDVSFPFSSHPIVQEVGV